jgi:hypothetical protein
MLTTLALATIVAAAAPTQRESLWTCPDRSRCTQGASSRQAVQPTDPVIDALIEAGPASIPFLVQKLEDDTEIEHSVFDFWPRVHVGDVAFAILCDFFTTPDWTTSTIPGLSWDALLGRPTADMTASDLLESFVAKHGRRGLRQRVEAVLEPYKGQLKWDPTRTVLQADQVAVMTAEQRPQPDALRRHGACTEQQAPRAGARVRRTLDRQEALTNFSFSEQHRREPRPRTALVRQRASAAASIG